MKINERALLHFAKSSENPIDNSGWLYKFGDDKKEPQKCWCVLKENLLFYYEHKSSREPLGVIILEGYRVEIVDDVKDRYAFKIDFGQSKFGLELKTYTFASDTHDEMEKWVKSLSFASYDYLKSAVAELQYRLDELNSMKQSEPPVQANHSMSRHNPFDESNNQNVTFIELHEMYGKQLRKYFKNQPTTNATDGGQS